MATSRGLTSASGLLSLLDEQQSELKIYALEKLNLLVDEFWAEIADSVTKIEELHEDDSFRARELAALVASKVYYHLGDFAVSMTYALGAAKMFDLTQKTEYVQTLVSKFVDEYVRLRTLQAESKSGGPSIDARLEAIVDNLFARCYADGEYRQALGVAFETRRLDKIQEAISQSGDVPGMLAYCFRLCMSVVTVRDFRQRVLKTLVQLYHQLPQPDYVSMVQCLVFLDQAKPVADVLDQLIKQAAPDLKPTLLAYQIAFDLYDIATQQFRANVREQLGGGGEGGGGGDYADRLAKLKQILTGETSVGLQLEFLCSHNKTDLAILKNIKTTVEGRNSVTHSATMFANALMHAGTTSDVFLRDNLEWLARATNWAKFSATAGLGVIHKGHIREGLSLLGPYLPPPGTGGGASPYSEGGALYALGLIHTNHGGEVKDYLARELVASGNNEIILHGTCLGLGLAAMASHDATLFESLKQVLYQDSAVAGEAAGLAMGLVMLGKTADTDEVLQSMLAYAHDTQHEKIIRGLAVGISLVMYAREEEADTLIEQLSMDKDPILRYGGMYTIGMAYCGTANNNAIRRLLHVAVSDVSDDVRRAAVIALGFVLLRQPRQIPRLVALLAESYNPHVRYGATLAVGIACAGTALKEAIELLEPMTRDSADFVRQGAYIALAMVLIQSAKAAEPKVESVRKLFEDKIGDKHEETMAKFGAILASGIIDAGGRNVTIALHSRSGHKNMTAIVGLAIFTQYWYWFPLVHFVSLAFTPTAIIALNKDLKMPKFRFKSNARPSLFAYPPEVKPPVAVAATKAPTAVLSVTNKKTVRATASGALSLSTSTSTATATTVQPEPMAVDKPTPDKPAAAAATATDKPAAATADAGAASPATTTATAPAPAPAPTKEKEPAYQVLKNPARVTVSQQRTISFDSDARYTPVKSDDAYGIVLLLDNRPTDPEILVTAAATAGAAAAAASASATDGGGEAPMPEPFELPE